MIATATTLNPLSIIAIDIYNPLGVLVASSPALPGAAAATVLLPTTGNYKARIRNMGISSLTHSPALIVREPWQH